MKQTSAVSFAAARVRLMLLVWVSFTPISHADPIHALDDGAFLHHDSGWIFPPQVAGFSLVGIPQDKDGSAEAVAYYAMITNSMRTTIVVDICPRELAGDLLRAKTQPASRPDANQTHPMSESTLQIDADRHITGIRVWRESADEAQPEAALYFVDAGAWVVTIVMAKGTTQDRSQLDDFVRGQQWAKLGS